jgi:phytoene dehydrogenase-like protein
MDLLVRTLMFAPPVAIDDITRALVAWGVEQRSEFLSVKLRKMSVADFLDKHFENDRIKAMLAFHAAICAYQPHVPGWRSASRCCWARSPTGICASAAATGWPTRLCG